MIKTDTIKKNLTIEKHSIEDLRVNNEDIFAC